MKREKQSDKTSFNQDQPWGYYAPTSQTNFWRMVTAVGLARGGIRKWIIKQWKNAGWHYVDFEKRGIRYRLDIINNSTDEKILSSSKIYDNDEIIFLSGSKVEKGQHFIDIGANTGYYSMSLCHKGFENILAIEPNPPTLRLLRKNIEFNQMNSSIEVVPVCVGEEGQVPFFSTTNLGGASCVPPFIPQKYDNLPSLPLEKILRIYSVEKIASLKIDIEGFEDRALRPFFLQSPEVLWPKRIVIEHCHKDKWDTDIIKFICQKGYGLIRKTRSNTFLMRQN